MRYLEGGGDLSGRTDYSDMSGGMNALTRGHEWGSSRDALHSPRTRSQICLQVGQQIGNRFGVMVGLSLLKKQNMNADQ